MEIEKVTLEVTKKVPHIVFTMTEDDANLLRLICVSYRQRHGDSRTAEYYLAADMAARLFEHRFGEKEEW